MHDSVLLLLLLLLLLPQSVRVRIRAFVLQTSLVLPNSKCERTNEMNSGLIVKKDVIMQIAGNRLLKKIRNNATTCYI